MGWDTLTSDQGLYCIVQMGARGVKHYFYTSREEMQANALRMDEEGSDVYFAPATFSDTKRLQANVEEVRAFWLDIDCGDGKDYLDVRAGVAALGQWLKDQRFLQPSLIVLSGGGLHVYWSLTAALPGDRWRRVAQRFKQAVRATGLRADPARTADSASILRVPGTHNHKYDPPRAVRILKEGPPHDIADFEAALPRVGPVGPVNASAPVQSKFAVQDEEWPPADAAVIAKRCAQMAHVRGKGGAVPEPLWRASLSILWRCEGAQQLVHDWSKGDPRYDPEETIAKARGTAGPATCTHIEECNPGGCAGCPFAGKVTSPILLGTMPAAPEKREDDPEERKDEIGPYRVTSRGVLRMAEDEEGVSEPVQVTRVPLWVTEVRERATLADEKNETALVLRWHAVDGQVKEATADAAEIYDRTLLTRWAATNNLYTQVVKMPELGYYINAAHHDLMQRQLTRKVYDRLGWFDGGFALGGRLYTPKGRRDVVMNPNSLAAQFVPQGARERWVAAAEALGHPDAWVTAFVMLAGMGAPLLNPCGLSGAVVSLAGPSGIGKSLSASFALSFWGPYESAKQQFTATLNAVDQKLGALRHLPHLMDELTDDLGQKSNEYVMMVANGRGKDRLDRGGNPRTVRTWNTISLCTTNSPLLELSESVMIEAHRRRVLELSLTRGLGPEREALLVEAMRDHAGSAAEPYIERMVGLGDNLPRLMEKAIATVRGWSPHLQQGPNRFVVWTLAAALLAGQIARSAGIISWNPAEVVKRAAGAADLSVSEIVMDTDRTLAIIAEFTTLKRGNTVMWSSDSTLAPADLPRVVEARWDAGTGTLYISSNALRDFAAERRMGYGTMRDWAKDKGIRFRAVRLAPGTAPIYCWVIKAREAGLDMEEK